jgi:hypothetical protein
VGNGLASDKTGRLACTVQDVPTSCRYIRGEAQQKYSWSSLAGCILPSLLEVKSGRVDQLDDPLSVVRAI